MKQLIIYIRLDAHNETIAVALAEAGKRSEVREYGKIANAPTAMKTLAAKLARDGHELRFCCEAGPCGYCIQRLLTVWPTMASPTLTFRSLCGTALPAR